jgi:hypothetical protein
MFTHVIFLSEESRMRALHVGRGKYWVRAKIGGVDDNAHTIAKNVEVPLQSSDQRQMI